MSNSLLQHVDCDLCGRNDYDLLHQRGNGICWVRCRDCGFIYTNPRLDDAALNREISCGYENGIPAYLGKYDEKKQTEYRKILKEFEKYRRLKNILEVGCNVGAFLYQARELGWNAKGVEPVYACAKHAREKYGLEVIAEVLEAACLPENSFDVVYSNAVFEHLPRPTSVLREVSRILRPGGVVYTCTVNYNSYTRELLGGKWHLLRASDHLSFYTPETIVRFHEKVGLKVIKLRSKGVRTLPTDNYFLRTIKKTFQSGLARFTLKGDRIIALAQKSW